MSKKKIFLTDDFPPGADWLELCKTFADLHCLVVALGKAKASGVNTEEKSDMVKS